MVNDMKKAIITFDMPSTCIECPFIYESDKIGTGEKYTYTQLYKCNMCPEDVEDIYLPDIVETKPEWCPIKVLPKKKEPSMFPISPLLHMQETQYEKGWNQCLDAIIKRGE